LPIPACPWTLKRKRPYRGLEPFDEEHAEYFFGREPELRRLREAVDHGPLVALKFSDA
jgi:hypothetical protein